MQDFTISILGSGSATPSLNRHPSGQVLSYGRHSYLIDCGEGSQMQMRSLRLGFNNIDAIFISHMHGDHIYGLPGLLSSISLTGRKNPLPIYGPQPLGQWLSDVLFQFEGMEYNIDFKSVNVQEPTLIHTDKHLNVYAFPLKHRVPTWGYRFEEQEPKQNLNKEMLDFFQVPRSAYPKIQAGEDYISPDGTCIENDRLTLPKRSPRSYAYCSDTVFHEPNIQAVQGVDLLYHEATYDEPHRDLAIKRFHSTPTDAANIADQAKVKQLLIGHFSNRYLSVEDLLKRAQSIFPNTIAAYDGLQISLPPQHRRNV